jgi:phosphohistidine phosphatase SixA
MPSITARMIMPISVLYGMSNAYIRVLVVGHNPGVQELAQMLTGETHLITSDLLVGSHQITC